MNVYVVGGAINYANWIKNLKLVNSPEKAQIVLFTGGEDVDPSIYGCKKYPRTWSNIARDRQEKAIFDELSPDQLVLGICRGLN